ncbi:MAG: cupin domain-containing protein [Granulicella sp.]
MPLKLIKSDGPASTYPEAGMTRQLLAWSKDLMLVRHRFEQGWIGAAHSHRHHQLVYILSGSIRIVAGGEEAIAHAGDSFVVDGCVEHQAFALEDSEVLDIFTPYREEYAL